MSKWLVFKGCLDQKITYKVTLGQVEHGLGIPDLIVAAPTWNKLIETGWQKRLRPDFHVHWVTLMAAKKFLTHFDIAPQNQSRGTVEYTV